MYGASGRAGYSLRRQRLPDGRSEGERWWRRPRGDNASLGPGQLLHPRGHPGLVRSHGDVDLERVGSAQRHVDGEQHLRADRLDDTGEWAFLATMPATSGTYAYFCTVHGLSMSGSVVVMGGAGTACPTSAQSPRT